MEQETHSMFGHIQDRGRLKLRKDFPTSVKPSYFHTMVEEEIKGDDTIRDGQPESSTTEDN